MQTPSVIGIFCEDIREEKSGQDTLVGIFPDNLNFAGVPGLIPKLGVYLRVNLDAGSPPPKIISASLISVDGTEINLPSWDANVIDKAFSESHSKKTPLVGLILKFVVSPFPINSTGKIVVKITIDGQDYIASNLQVVSQPETPKAS